MLLSLATPPHYNIMKSELSCFLLHFGDKIQPFLPEWESRLKILGYCSYFHQIHML